jgi:hypothetical protein
VRHMNQEDRLQDMPKHKWKFKSHFRKQTYGWKGTALASKRMREAVSEIKKVNSHLSRWKNIMSLDSGFIT